LEEALDLSSDRILNELNLNQKHIIKFASSKLLTYPLNTVYKNQALTVTKNIKFLCMELDLNLTWKSHIDNLT
jgi:hypothetical protein